MSNKVIAISINEDLYRDAKNYIMQNKNKKMGHTFSSLVRKVLIEYLESKGFYTQENTENNNFNGK